MKFSKKIKYLFIALIPMYIVILYFQPNKRKLGIRKKSALLMDVPYGENTPLQQ
ncbi:hypothetical protein [Bacillus sp. NPDC057893]|uniref:hypothetical protein n=1 Tax=Bacillus sp. NPDC057893 TaxID=3346273 RepID=UPI003671A3CC